MVAVAASVLLQSALAEELVEFVPEHDDAPTEPARGDLAASPTLDMLATWLAQRELPDTAAKFLSLINGQIEDHDAQIGPSYFMTTDQSVRRMRRIFATQIEPLLRETYYDRWSTVGSRFEFDRLWAAAGGGSGRFDDSDPAMVPVELPPPVVAETAPMEDGAEA